MFARERLRFAGFQFGAAGGLDVRAFRVCQRPEVQQLFARVPDDELVVDRLAQVASQFFLGEASPRAVDLLKLFDRERRFERFGRDRRSRAPGGAANRGAEGFRGWRRAVDVPLALGVRVTVVEFQLDRVGGRRLDRRREDRARGSVEGAAAAAYVRDDRPLKALRGLLVVRGNVFVAVRRNDPAAGWTGTRGAA